MNLQQNQIDVCIIGGGVSGLFLASKFISNQQSVLIIENNSIVGGQINLYREKKIYNIPLIDSITGKDVITQLYNKLKNSEFCQILTNSSVSKIDKQNEMFNITITYNSNTITTNIDCKYIVFAYGKGVQEANKLPIINADEYENKSLFYSVDDKMLFKNKNVIISGGGDSVIDWACELNEIAENITIVHRRNIEKPDNPQFLKFKNLIQNNKITLKTPFNISKLCGENGILNEVIVSNETQNETIKCDYLLTFYGLKQTFKNLDIYKNVGIDFDDKNYVKVNYSTNETNIKNIFAVGDCCTFDGKITNILMCFSDCMRCFYTICNNESGKINIYEHK